MAKDTLAVYCPCQVYLERLLAHINSKNGNSYEAVGFTELEVLKRHLADYRVKAVLFSQAKEENSEKEGIQECLTEIAERKIDVVMLGEQSADYAFCCNMLGKERAEGFYYIDMYQSIRFILAELGRIMKSGGLYNETSFKNDYYLAGIYSPADKISHPEMAVRIARNLRGNAGMENAKVLYINLEPFCGLSEELDYQSEYNISDLIYAYRTNPDKLPEILKKASVQSTGIFILLSSADCDDLKELDDGSWPDFLAAIAEAGGFNAILIDLFNFFIEVVMMCLKHGNLYIPALPCFENDSRVSLLNDTNRKLMEQKKSAETKRREFRKYCTERLDAAFLNRIIELEI